MAAGGDPPLLPLWERVFPTVILLAVDVEPLTRQLFYRLTFQLIRWFSNADTHKDESAALLSALMDGIASQTKVPTDLPHHTHRLERDRRLCDLWVA